MLDAKWVRENTESVAKAALDKGMFFGVEEFCRVYDERLKLLQQTEELRSKRNLGSAAVQKDKTQE